MKQRIEYGYFGLKSYEIGIEFEDAESMSHQGECYADCEALVAKYADQLTSIPLIEKIEGIQEYGLELSDSEKQDHKELDIRILWLLSGDITDRNYANEGF